MFGSGMPMNLWAPHCLRRTVKYTPEKFLEVEEEEEEEGG